MKRNLLYVLGVVCLMTSCVEENFENHGVSPMAGKEVVFSADMNDGPVTRTNYGDPVTNTSGTTTAFKVNWADNDSVLVYCVDSKTSGKYEVVPAVDENGEYLNYAEDLVKDGEHGVQWSDSETSTFVAVYPAKNSSVSEDGVITTNISSVQNNVFEPIYGTDGTTVTGWKGKAFDNDANSPTMTNGIMFARTVASPKVTDENGNQTTTTNTVNLRFKPYSTALKFKFAGYTTNTGSSIETIYVQKVELTAPVAVAGQFDLTVSNTGAEAAVTACSTTSSTTTITLNTILPGGTYVPLRVGQSLEFDIFTIPSDDYVLSADWAVKLTTDQGDFTYKLKPASTTENKLAAGKINKINVPSLNVVNTTPWDYSKWMTQIPKPVYLSELSMPGTWYSAHSDYQNTTDLTLQYNAGIRAFNIDCRLTWESEGGEQINEGSWYNPSYRDPELYLVVAGSDGSGTAGSNYHYGDLVLDKLKTIAGLIPLDEYVVVVLTIAEKPLTRNPLFGDTIVSGYVDPAQVVPAITSMLNENASALKLYTSKITKDTTVEDVLGHMIVKINANNSTIGSYTYPTSSLVSFASMAMSDYNTDSDNITDLATDYYTKIQTAPMYWGNAATDLTYYYHQAQRTTSGVNSYDDTGAISGTNYGSTYQVEGVPTLQMRKDAIKDIVDKSTEIYDSSTHNGWFQLGIGGYTKDNDYADNSQSAVATELNTYVQTLIQEKMESDPSPVGIVLMNHATDANGNAIQLVKDIIEMNGKFYLKRKGGDIITGNEGDNDGGIDEGEGDEL